MAMEPVALTQVALEPEDHPRYSRQELLNYFDSISLPKKHIDTAKSLMIDDSLRPTRDDKTAFLQVLVRHHLCNVPFENLVLHYSKEKKVSLDPKDLYTKFVTNHRGGRCMENNTFFATVLRSLFLEVRNCGGRVARSMSPYPEVRKNQSRTYDGWNHMLNLVWLDDEWWVVDVGMGSMGPCMPYPLRDGFETVSIAPRRIRLQQRRIAESYAKKGTKAAPGPTMWCYDFCVKEDEWLPAYCFTETEFLPQDYEVMSWFTSTHNTSFFTRMVMCTKMIMSEDGEKIIGNNTLAQDKIAETIGSERKVIWKFKTEEERMKALTEVFGMKLTDDEKAGIPEERALKLLT